MCANNHPNQSFIPSGASVQGESIQIQGGRAEHVGVKLSRKGDLLRASFVKLKTEFEISLVNPIVLGLLAFLLLTIRSWKALPIVIKPLVGLTFHISLVSAVAQGSVTSIVSLFAASDAKKRRDQSVSRQSLNASNNDNNDRPSDSTLPDIPMLNISDEYIEAIRHQQSPEEHEIVVSIGHQVRTLRKAHHYSISKLASLLSIDKEIILAVENGDGNPVTATHLLQKVKDLVGDNTDGSNNGSRGIEAGITGSGKEVSDNGSSVSTDLGDIATPTPSPTFIATPTPVNVCEKQLPLVTRRRMRILGIQFEPKPRILEIRFYLDNYRFIHKGIMLRKM